MDDTLIPQHRLGRGMGGSKARDVPSNIIVFCADQNQRIEENYVARERARRNGWSLQSWEDPATTPVFDMTSGEWYVLGDDFSRVVYSPNHN